MTWLEDERTVDEMHRFRRRCTFGGEDWTELDRPPVVIQRRFTGPCARCGIVSVKPRTRPVCRDCYTVLSEEEYQAWAA